MAIDIQGPVIVKKGYLDIVCFYEGDYLLLFFPVSEWVPSKRASPFLVGDIIELPKGRHRVIQVEIIPQLDMEYLEKDVAEKLRRRDMVFTSRFLCGYRYKLNPINLIF